MKLFLANNWYKLSIALSLLISSIAFLLFSAGRSFADPNKPEKTAFNKKRTEIVANQDGIFAVSFDVDDYSVNYFDVKKIK
jgi:hypothetical protein